MTFLSPELFLPPASAACQRHTLWRVSVMLLLTACMLVIPHKLSAQAGGQVSAMVEPQETRPGSTVLYSIVVQNGRPDALPNLRLPQSVQLINPTPIHQQSIRNGRSTITFTWQLLCQSEGVVNFPEQTILINGVPQKVPAVKLVVKDNPASPSSQLEPLMMIELAKSEFYEGETIPIVVKLYANSRVDLRRIGLIELPKDNFAIGRFPLQGEEEAVMMGGVRYQVNTFRSTLTGMKAGKFKLGPAKSEIIMDIPTGGSSLHHPMLLPPSERVTVTPQSNEIEVKVLPLPTDGKPAGFTGLVGDFKIAVDADPVEVDVGDPISVEISVSGNGNFDALSAPNLTSPSDWKVYPAKRYSIDNGDAIEEGVQRVGFSQVFIPKKTMSELPPFELSFFSPTTKKYVTLRSPAIPLKVTQGAPLIEASPAGTAAASGAVDLALTPEKMPQARALVTDIITAVPIKTTWLLARSPLWENRNFIVANSIAGGFLLLLIAGKIMAVYARAQAKAPDADARKIWRQMKDRRLNRVQFYSLAAKYAQEKHLQHSGIAQLLTKHQELSYGATSAAADETPIGPVERAEILAALQQQ